MAPHRGAVLGLLLAQLFALLLSVGAQQIEYSVSYFDNLPARLFFFEDTTV